MSVKLIKRCDTASAVNQRLKAERDDMVPSMAQKVAYSQDTQKCFQNILGPLSLFSHADKDDVKKRDRAQEARSESSASEKIMNVPATLSELCQQLRGRLNQQSPPLSHTEDQEMLVSLITSKLGLIWRDLCGMLGDPMLTSDENRWLRGRTFGEVLHICERLYLHYLHLLDALERRSVFSPWANRNRLAARMALDLSSLLNVHSIRRRIAMGIKATQDTGYQQVVEMMHADACPRELDLRLHVKPGCKKCAASRQQQTTVEKELIEIQEKIGELDLECVYKLIPCHLELITSKMETLCATPCSTSKAEEEEDQLKTTTRLKGCNSMPELQRETLLEELEMAALPARSQSSLGLLSISPGSGLEEHITPAEDLRRLLQDANPVEKFDSETDIPPLIRALSTSGSSKLKQLTHVLWRLEDEEGRRRETEGQGEAERPQPPQAEVVSVSMPTQGVVWAAASRVSDRVCLDTISISMCPPVYNDLTGEIEALSVKWLDRNLFDRDEIKDVYEELSQSLPIQYLNFDEDPMIETCLNIGIPVLDLKRKNHEKKLMNSSLHMPNPYGISHRKRTDMMADHKRPTDVTSRAYAAWHRWWKSNLTPNDYLNYLSDQSDYLSVVFHLYDSDDSDEEDECEKLLQLQRERKRRQLAKTDALRRHKQAYTPGLWNVNSVLLGGLGKEPALDEVEGADEEIQHVVRGGQGAVDNHTHTMPEGDEQVQARLERIWTTLHLSETQRLDMAIKYSSATHRDRLEEAIVAWEKATNLIQQREKVLLQLEQFEKVASDPNRFFQRGYNGTSAARMEEASSREKLQSQIAALDKLLSQIIHHIAVTFKDTVTYKGRPYGEKMRWDCVEMLYWLQQERRAQALEKLVEGRGILPARLPPINSSHILYPHLHPTPEEHFPLAIEENIQCKELLCFPCTNIEANAK
ncbi:coiled-coil domain-containing protein 87 isoform X2 [Electrophorus electricus]|uniref:coiled-coil domain-containing protein 87 isoform X2 n=1 Tax=Electrophorus electricus TaxID=8005 RepID=UPI0015D06262|nr:coiled-coil domain-containing protein 87 isoform X2 [Electrophorus electricus]